MNRFAIIAFDEVQINSKAGRKAKRDVIWLCAFVGHVVFSAICSIVFLWISTKVGKGFVSTDFLHLLLSENVYCAQSHAIRKALHISH